MNSPKLRANLLLQLVENTQDGIVVAEKEGQDTIIIYVNSAFERLTGYKSEEILYQDCRFLQGKDTSQDAVKSIRKAIDAEEPVRSIIKNYRKDGSIFWNELSVTPYYDTLDKVTYYIGIQKDVTNIIELEQALNAAQQEAAELKTKLDKTENN